MMPKQVALVQASWEKIRSTDAAQVAAELFYARLFGLDPSIEPMFKGDMKEQARKLAAMVTFAVNGLTRVEAITPGLQALGQRHAGLGVKERHYETVGEALLWTLGKGLGPDFTGEVKEAWAIAYSVIAAAMRAPALQAA